jgi:hypothetical protein
MEGRHRAGSARCSLILLPPNHRRRGLHRMQTVRLVLPLPLSIGDVDDG